MNTSSLYQEAESFFGTLQMEICTALETLDGTATFRSDRWSRPDPDGHGGGGVSRILRNGAVFEQAGVNFSAVHGTLPGPMAKRLLDTHESIRFSATGVSLVIHPLSPQVPTTHANFRYFETESARWFGGGMDLTPYILYESDAAHFHRTIQSACDPHDPEYYQRFKAWCDEYFFLPHRGETRGVGGAFFDYLGRDAGADLDKVFAFVKDIGRAFLPAYLPIVRERAKLAWTEAQRTFQLVRRGRYVEFNLLYDRGTQFGLQTKGRTESILMSLPPLVRWEYDYQVPTDSPEAQLLAVLRTPRSWV